MAQPRRGKNQVETGALDGEARDHKLWNTHGLEDVYFQRESQVNFWSIMGGLAAGALLTQFFPLVEQVQASRWYLVLYFLASIFVLVNGWTQTSWGALILRWRISLTLVLPHFLTLMCMAVMCLLVTNPAGWSLAEGGVLFFLLLHQNIFRRSGAWEMYSRQRVKEIVAGLWVYFFLMLTCFGASAYMFFRPSRIFEMIWGIIVLLASTGAMVLQHNGMEHERKELGIP